MPYSCSMAMDKYTSFADLRGSESRASFAIDVETRPESHVIVIAPHGGKIEVLTSEIARRIAGSDFSYYSFTGAKVDHNRDLHITSHRFDEPTGVALVAKHQWVVAIHGCRGDSRASCLAASTWTWSGMSLLDSHLAILTLRRSATLSREGTRQYLQSRSHPPRPAN